MCERAWKIYKFSLVYFIYQYIKFVKRYNQHLWGPFLWGPLGSCPLCPLLNPALRAHNVLSSISVSAKGYMQAPKIPDNIFGKQGGKKGRPNIFQNYYRIITEFRQIFARIFILTFFFGGGGHSATLRPLVSHAYVQWWYSVIDI